jgi:hypothetical protein
VTVFPSALGQAAVEPLGQQTVRFVTPVTETQLPWQQTLAGVPPRVAGSVQVLAAEQQTFPPEELERHDWPD